MVTLFHTFQCFIEADDIDFDEAVESAVSKRKFLINRVMKRNSPNEMGGEFIGLRAKMYSFMMEGSPKQP